MISSTEKTYKIFEIVIELIGFSGLILNKIQPRAITSGINKTYVYSSAIGAVVTLEAIIAESDNKLNSLSF